MEKQPSSVIRKFLPVKKGSLVQRHFDSIAKKYDFMNTLLSFGLHYLWKRTAVKMMNLTPGKQGD